MSLLPHGRGDSAFSREAVAVLDVCVRFVLERECNSFIDQKNEVSPCSLFSDAREICLANALRQWGATSARSDTRADQICGKAAARPWLLPALSR